MTISPSRRTFMRRLGALGAVAAGPLVACSGESQKTALSSSETVRSGKAARITILHTGDIHAQLYTHDEFFFEGGRAVYRKRGGFAVLKSMIDALRAENQGNTILVDGGDCFQGSGLAALSEGRAIVPLMNHVGYDLVLPGNWEVVYGKQRMMSDLNAYAAHKICANMFHARQPEGAANRDESSDLPETDLLFPAYWTTVVGGVKLGFVGYNDPLTPRRQSPAYSYGIRFTPPEANVARYIRRLRDDERCAIVFLVTHLGLAQQVDLANKREVEGADFILGADTHERVRRPMEGQYAKVTEPGAFGSFVSRLDLVVDQGKVKETNYQLLDVDPEKYPPDPRMLALIAEQRAPFSAELDKAIGATRSTLVRYYVIENPMDNLITDAMMWKLKPDVAVSNGFRFGPPIVADERHPAVITNDHLWSMVPVDSEAKYGAASGQQIWEWLEMELDHVFAKHPANRFGGWVVRFKGMEVNFTMRNDLNHRLNWVKIGGRPLEREKVYRIAACEREGDPINTLCRLERVSEPHLAGITVHAILRDYLKEFSPVSPRVEGRITATDAPPDLLSQLEGYGYEFH
ncbi:MAG: bifunctional metallophosphatase/5'-nucleotidase [Acidobacteria bacterium]|nr:MAG: bifunctional metallophosphatase/5'-nucleotidase [Acidobacteriota bacterium]PYR53196.1 MAG: bifunctional metallophosphatase/5'-nucleotidase [Acidobacteriota bacterium]